MVVVVVVTTVVCVAGANENCPTMSSDSDPCSGSGSNPVPGRICWLVLRSFPVGEPMVAEEFDVEARGTCALPSRRALISKRSLNFRIGGSILISEVLRRLGVGHEDDTGEARSQKPLREMPLYQCGAIANLQSLSETVSVMSEEV